MYRITLIIATVLFMVACNQTGQKKGTEGEITEKIVAATIEELVAEPVEYKDLEVAIEGMVTHVCRHGGQKCFVLAEDGETQIRLVPSGDIDEFKIELEGSDIAVKGKFRVMSVAEAEEHVEDHESKAHHAVEQSHSEAEKADIFIEVSQFREITQ
jgi:hypothetical protein